MEKKNVLLFVVLFTIAFAVLVSIKFFDRNKLINLNQEFSLENNQLVKVANKDYTNIKLMSIKEEDCSSGTCLVYRLLINNKEYYVEEIPMKIKIYDEGILEVLDGDEDRLVMKMTEK